MSEMTELDASIAYLRERGHDMSKAAAELAALRRVAETAQVLWKIARFIVPLSESEEVFELENALKALPK